MNAHENPVYGHFDDERREFVVTAPDTPYPWINYLGTEDFFSLRSNTGGGYCFCKDARLLRLTRYRYNNVPCDAGGHYFYIREGDTVFCPGGRPARTPLDFYECRHGLGYTRITGEKNGLRAVQEMLVPRGATAEVTRVTLTNRTDATKKVSLYSFVEFCLWDAMDDSSNFQRNYNIGEVEIRGGAIIHRTEYRERRNHYAVFAVNAAPDGFDTDRESFFGLYNGFDAPAAVLEDRPRGSVASGWAPIGSHCLRRELAAGESASFLFVLGYCENPPDAKFLPDGSLNPAPMDALLARFRTDAQFDAAMTALSDYWQGLLSHYALDCQDAKLARMVNVWNQYQCMVTFNLSRSASYFESGIGRGLGFRDTSQDMLGFVHLVPERARERLLDVAATQKPDGGAYHQFQPLTKRGNEGVGSGFNDDPLWLIYAAAAYLKETGDTALLAETVPFDNNENDAAPFAEHLRRAFHYTLSKLGPHGLPLIGRADWNDCLNLNCHSTVPGESFQTVENFDTGIAESVFIAAMFVAVCDDYARLLRLAGDDAEADAVPAHKAAMDRAIHDNGWDGGWFLRAYDAFGRKVGSHECEEGKLYIEPQGFAIMAGLGIADGRAQKALDAVRAHLLGDDGAALLWPPYTRYDPDLGEVSSYPPSYKENGSVFCHNNPWIMIAETVLGHGDRAFDLYQRVAPAYCQNQRRRRVEPYVYAQTVAGPFAPNAGEAKNSWLTGTAAWNFVCVSQHILGIKPTFDGLRFDPCLPAYLRDITVTRVFRGNTYVAHILNRTDGEKGEVTVTADGVPAPDGEVRVPANAGRTVRVEVVVA